MVSPSERSCQEGALQDNRRLPFLLSLAGSQLIFIPLLS